MRAFVRGALSLTSLLAARPGIAASSVAAVPSFQDFGDPNGCDPLASSGMQSRSLSMDADNANSANTGKSDSTDNDTQSKVATATRSEDDDDVLSAYPGTALARLEAARARAASLTEAELSGDWKSDVRPRLLWAAGLKDLTNVAPGSGYTGHCFNDFNHVSATTMTLDVSDNENRGQVQGIAFGNRLGPGIKVASDPELGPGGSWCTCAKGGKSEPPQDVAHVQFQSKVAWQLVWVPGREGQYERFVLVDDEGEFLASGVPGGDLPRRNQRERNFRMLQGGRYGRVAEAYSRPEAGAGEQEQEEGEKEE